MISPFPHRHRKKQSTTYSEQNHLGSSHARPSVAGEALFHILKVL